MTTNQKLPDTEELLTERAELLKFLEQIQQQILMSNQRVAFLNGVLSERGVDLNAQPALPITPPTDSKKI